MKSISASAVTLMMLMLTAMVMGEEASCDSVVEPLPVVDEVTGALASNHDDYISFLQTGSARHASKTQQPVNPLAHGYSRDDTFSMKGFAKKSCKMVPGYFNGAAVYHEAVRRFNTGIFLEVGAFLGMSTCYMSHLLQAQQKDNIQFDVIDIWGSVENDFKPWVTDEFYEIMKSHGEDAKATFDYDMQISGADKRIRSVTQGSSMDVNLVDRYEDESISFLYLDTSHEYDFTIAELDLWYPKIKVGGMLCGDDWDLIAVKRALEDWTHSMGKDYRLLYSSSQKNMSLANFCMEKKPLVHDAVTKHDFCAAGNNRRYHFSELKTSAFAKKGAVENCDVVPGFDLSISAGAYNEAVSQFDSGVFVEVGSFLGRSTCYMAHLLKYAPHGKNVKFDTIDTWGSVDANDWAEPEFKVEMKKHGEDAKDSFDYFMRLTNASYQIRNAIKGSSQDKNVVNRYEDNSVSFLYLDTSHEHDDTIDELSLWFPKIKVGGRLCGSTAGVGGAAEDWAKASGNRLHLVYSAAHPVWQRQMGIDTCNVREIFCVDKGSK